MFLRNLPMRKGHTFGGNCREIPRISTNPKSESFHWPKGSETLLPSLLAEARRSRNIVAVDNLWRERNAHPSNTSEASWAVHNAVTYTCWILLIGLLWTKPLFHHISSNSARSQGCGGMRHWEYALECVICNRPDLRWDLGTFWDLDL